MKTLLYRVMVSSLAFAGLMLVAGCEEGLANTNVPTVTNSTVPIVTPATEAATNAPALGEVTDFDDDFFDPADPESDAPAVPARVVDKAVIPENLKVSPALEEIIKLVQAGVSEEVIMTYVTNSTNLFQVGSDEIVYLNDLGVSTALVTALIQHDASPAMIAQRKAVTVAQPLPAGVALNAPAGNVYPGGPPPEATNQAEALPPAYEEAPAATEQTVTYAQAPVTVSHFYTSLSPYGTWVEVDGYGLCWQPTVAVANRSWRPYSDSGRWLWSDAGWYWYSDYSWGWAPFHYGRWCTYPRLGWIWVPDTHWGPSWVSWRYNNSYCGWAPLPPGCHYRSGFGLYYRNSAVSIGFDFGLSPSCYTYIPFNRFCDRRPHLYYASRSHGSRLHRETTVVNNIVGNNNTIINNGVGRDRVARVTPGGVPRAAIRDGGLVSRNSRRPERLERNDSTLVVTRPQLPADPPARPRVVAAKASSEQRKPASSLGLSPNNGSPASSLVTPGVADPGKSGSAARRRGEQSPPVVRANPDRPTVPNQPSAAVPSERAPKADRPSPKSEAGASTAKPARNPNANANAQRPDRSSGVTAPSTSGNEPAGVTRGINPDPNRPVTGIRGSRNFSSAPNLSQPVPAAPVNPKQAEPAGNEGKVAGNARPAPSGSIARQPFQARASGNSPSINTRPPQSVSPPAARSRVYVDPPAAAPRASSPMPQATRPHVSRPAPNMAAPAPMARPQFNTAPRMAPPVMRSEPMRPSAPAARSDSGPRHSPPAASAPRSQQSAPARSQSGGGGGGRSDRARP